LSDRLTIALDAMGGDQAPRMVLRGADLARKRHPQVQFLVYGREQDVQPYLSKLKKLRQVTTLVHCEDVVSDNEKPSTALRNGRNSIWGPTCSATRRTWSTSRSWATPSRAPCWARWSRATVC
jgi:glycerol-3-phosphate acyltransferase PlsX